MTKASWTTWKQVKLTGGEIMSSTLSLLWWIIGQFVAIFIWASGLLSLAYYVAADAVTSVWVMITQSPETLVSIVNIFTTQIWPLALSFFAAVVSMKLAAILPAAVALVWASIVAWGKIRNKIELQKRRRWRQDLPNKDGEAVLRKVA